jgi:hypothetical protein
MTNRLFSDALEGLFDLEKRRFPNWNLRDSHFCKALKILGIRDFETELSFSLHQNEIDEKDFE